MRRLLFALALLSLALSAHGQLFIRVPESAFQAVPKVVPYEAQKGDEKPAPGPVTVLMMKHALQYMDAYFALYDLHSQTIEDARLLAREENAAIDWIDGAKARSFWSGVKWTAVGVAAGVLGSLLLGLGR